MRILIVEDEPKLAKATSKGLVKKGYAVDVVSDSGEALTRITVHASDHDLVILELVRPTPLWAEFCKKVRENEVALPLLVLTPLPETKQKVDLLVAGADDYLVKPFSFDELFARIQALLRRPSNTLPSVLTHLDIELDPASHTVKQNGKEIVLTLKEFRLLEYFLRHPDRVVNREDMLAHLWDFNYEAFSNVVDVHIKNLRRKLDRKNVPSIIQTVRGIGYRLKS